MEIKHSKLPRVSVVIPVRKRDDIQLERLLSSLESQSYAGETQIVIGEGNSPAKARNNGLKKVEGEIICFIDSDCIPHKDWIKELIRGHSLKGCDKVGGPMCSVSKGIWAKSFDFIFSDFSPHLPMEMRNMIPTANVSIKNRQGLYFDERLICGEDHDFFNRYGKVLFNPKAKVFHEHKKVRFKDYITRCYQFGLWGTVVRVHYKRYPKSKLLGTLLALPLAIYGAYRMIKPLPLPGIAYLFPILLGRVSYTVGVIKGYDKYGQVYQEKR